MVGDAVSGLLYHPVDGTELFSNTAERCEQRKNWVCSNSLAGCLNQQGEYSSTLSHCQ